EIRKGLEEGEKVVLNPKLLVGDSVKTRKPGEYQDEEQEKKPTGPSVPSGPGIKPAAKPGAGGAGAGAGAAGGRRPGRRAGWRRSAGRRSTWRRSGRRGSGWRWCGCGWRAAVHCGTEETDDGTDG